MKKIFRKMLVSLSAAAIIIILLMIVLLILTDGEDEDPITPEQEKWLEVLEETYPDDDFYYKGHEKELLGSYDGDKVIIVNSRLFPDSGIHVKEDEEGHLISNYLKILYEEAVNKYYNDKISNYIDFDEIRIWNESYAYYPVEYLSEEEYIKQYFTENYNVEMHYDKGHDYPNQEEMINAILKYLADATSYEGSFFFCRTGSSDWDYRVDVLLTEDGVLRELYFQEELNYEKECIVNIQMFEDVLRERGIK